MEIYSAPGFVPRSVGYSGIQTRYSCRLCEVELENKDAVQDHLTRLSHKLAYLQRHFRRVKEVVLEQGGVTMETVDHLACKLEVDILNHLSEPT